MLFVVSRRSFSQPAGWCRAYRPRQPARHCRRRPWRRRPGLAPSDVKGVEDALQVALDLDGPTVVAHLLHLHLLILLAATTGSVEAERGTGRGIEGEHRTLGRILHLAKRLLRLQGLRGEQQGHTTGHHQLSHHTLAGNFVRMDSCPAETRGILWRVPRDGQARPIITIYNVAKSKILC